METTTHYSVRTEGDKDGAIARIAIYARLSRDPGGLSVNTSIQVAECLEEARRYANDRVLQVTTPGARYAPSTTVAYKVIRSVNAVVVA